MSATTKMLLAFAVIAFALSFAPFFGDIGYGLLRPFGAAGFILSFINHILAKELELYDEDQRSLQRSVLPRSTANTDQVDFTMKSQENNRLAA